MPITKDINTRANVRQRTAGDVLNISGQPVVAKYEATSVASQTLIPNSGSLPFIVDTLNKENFELFVDGKLLREGSGNDYQFTQLDANNGSARILMNAPMAAGLNIQAIKRGLKKEREFNVDNRLTQIYDAAGVGLQNFVDESSLLTPVNGAPGAGQFRTFGIVGRASIPDLANDMKARMAVDRRQVQYLLELPSEFGSNGERVWKDFNDSKNLIRFVGNWTVAGISSDVPSTSGLYPISNSVDDFVEIVFYGTGLNILLANFGNTDIRATVDGGSEGSNLTPTAVATILTGRNYIPNTLITVVSGLSSGLHSVKIRTASIAGNRPGYSGFETLNESSQIKVQPGTAYSKLQKLSLSAQQLLNYNSSFDSILRDGVSVSSLGSRGARALLYIKSDGTLGKSSIEANSTQGNFGSADHTNEEVIRSYFWREFGASRADDFTTVVNSQTNRAFTLDDGTTSLVGNNIQKASQVTVADALQLSATNSFVTLTFVGTGLDMWSYGDVTAAADAHEFFIDGISLGTLNPSVVADRRYYTKIVSGLPYGTHTFKINRNATAASSPYNIEKFVVYGPKKPTLPSGATELAEYYITANFVANTTAGLERISTGVLRKSAIREMTYVNGTGGTTNWAVSGLSPTSEIGGFDLNTDRQNSYFEYTFFGTGFDLRFPGSTVNSANVQVSLQALSSGGSLQNLTITNFPTIVSSVYGTGIAFNSSTGILDMVDASPTNGNGFTISNLPLGEYKVRFLNNTASAFILLNCLDIITPIHSVKSNLPADLQNTLSIGSQGLLDTRALSPIKVENKKKAFAQAVGVVSSPSTSSTFPVPMPDMSCTVTTEDGLIELNAEVYVANTGNNMAMRFYVNGIAVGVTINNGGANINFGMSNSVVVRVPKGTHKVDLYWSTNTGTVGINGTSRIMSVKEL